MKCKGSGQKLIVSDYSAITLEAKCPACNGKVKITIPDIVWHANTAKFSIHQEITPIN